MFPTFFCWRHILRFSSYIEEGTFILTKEGKDMDPLVIVPPVLGGLALLFAAALAARVARQDAGNDRMKEISAFIHEGAQAFLMAEYRILLVFVAVLFVAIGLGISWITAVAFLVGAIFSTIAGYCGMNVATRANVRTAAAAKDSGMNKALSIAFSGGAVMGMCVVGLGLLGCGVVWLVTGDTNVLSGFSLGASSIALFARVGGGIYTKAADVGADLVSLKMTPVTPPPSPTTWATTLVTWPAWALTCLNPMWAPLFLQSPWAL